MSKFTRGCKCKSGCRTKRCGCKQNGKQCGPGCRCLNCENVLTTNALCPEEHSLMDLDIAEEVEIGHDSETESEIESETE